MSTTVCEHGQWTIVTRPMLIDSQRPEYCRATEDCEQCPDCPATMSGKDIVDGACQALRGGPPPQPLVEIVLVPKSALAPVELHSNEAV
jgi:hypothetical protein